MQTFKEHSAEIIRQVLALSKQHEEVTPETVYTAGRPDLLPYVNKIVESLAQPGSGIAGFDHLYKLFELAKAGHACVLMVEHYSNLDLPEFYYFLEQQGPRGKDIQNAVVAIAGMKLTLDDPGVAAFASIYSRIVICPSRAVAHLDPVKDKDKLLFISSLNRAATKALADVKKSGKIILVYPAGTRYRPWVPDSKRGVREIDSYVKGFDYMCFVSKNGVIMRVREDAENDMLADYMVPDVLRFTISGPVSCAAFREKVRAAVPEDADKKQAVVDEIMRRLEEMHNAASALR
jgi:glycerol-3-phosphate O-acyltransferase